MAANKLTAVKVQKTKTAGLHGDGGGLYLKVTKEGTKSWVYRFMLDGKARWMGLGRYPVFSLAEARQRALDAAKLKTDGINPIDQRHAQRIAQRVDAAKAITFQECAEKYIAAHRASWKHPKHVQQWESSLARYVYPIIGALPVGAIDTGLVMKIVEPLWSEKTETASRVRNRVELVLDWAKARHYRDGENPSRWKGHLDKLLPKKAKVTKPDHYAALPYDQMPAFMAELRQQTAPAARALEFIILTGTRVSDLAGSLREDRTPMLWEHVSNATWVIPATKNESEHKVPLSPRAIEILEAMRGADGAFVFPRITNSMVYEALKRLTGDATIHGFRSTFRTWAAERTNYPREVCKQALAHVTGTAVEQAYQRGDLFEKRRKLMAAWESFCRGTPDVGAVIPLRAIS